MVAAAVAAAAMAATMAAVSGAVVPMAGKATVVAAVEAGNIPRDQAGALVTPAAGTVAVPRP